MTLTERETEILIDYCRGLSLKESAANRGVSAGAVSFHRNSIFRITQHRSPMSLLFWAVEQGLIEFPKCRQKRIRKRLTQLTTYRK